MSKLLYIQASPWGRRSYCIAVSNAFIETCKLQHPDDKITASKNVEKVINRFKAADKYLLATPDYDLQKKYIELILGFIGFENIQSMVIEPPLANGSDVAASKRQEAAEKIKEIAANFWDLSGSLWSWKSGHFSLL